MGFITNTGKIKTFGDYDYDIPFQSFRFDLNKPFVGVLSYSDERVIYGISFLTYICKTTNTNTVTNTGPARPVLDVKNGDKIEDLVKQRDKLAKDA